MPLTRGRPRIQVAPCKFCHKQFKRLEHLQRHERIHTREKPFKCKCGHGFSRQDLLARHHRHHHAEDEGEITVIDDDVTDVVSQASPESSDTPHKDTSDHQMVDEPVAELHLDPRLSQSQPDEQILSVEKDNIAQECQDSTVENQIYLQTPAQSFELPPAEPFLFGIDGDQELEFLWNNFSGNDQPLPATFFDTDISLVDVSQQYSVLPPADNFIVIQPVDDGSDLRGDQHEQRRLPENPGTSQSHLAASRLPSLEPNGRSSTSHASLSSANPPWHRYNLGATCSAGTCPWKISLDDYQKLSQAFAASRGNIPSSFAFPSRQALSRYLEGYFRGFHAHLPFLHTASTSTATLGLELILALAAVGALYRFEHAKGFELYRIAKTLINEQLDHLNEETLFRLTSTSPGYAGFANPQHGPGPHGGWASGSPQDAPSPVVASGQTGLRLLQGLIVLMALASWGDRALVRDGLSMSSRVALLVREFGIGAPEDTRPNEAMSKEASWEQWIRYEERRRTLFVAYILFNLQSVAFNVPPMILNQEVQLSLPTSGAEWEATSADAWHQISSIESHPQYAFRYVLHELLLGHPVHEAGAISAFGNYTLIHGLLQQIFFMRNGSSCLPDSSPLSGDLVKKIETALRSWQESWEATYESTLDPSSPKGPLGFNSTALLRLAYIRLNANTGPGRQLATRDPAEIVQAFNNSKVYIHERSPHLDRAVLQCIHALSIPIRVGIAFVSRTQTFNWSFQHAICNLECALLLAHWLQALALDIELMGVDSIRPDENKLLNMLVTLVRETEWTEGLDDIDASLDHASRIRRLAASSVRIWAETFKGFQVFELVHMIGTGLSAVADVLDKR